MHNQIYKMFLKVAQAKAKDGEYKTEREWFYEGVSILEKRLLGSFKTEIVKTIDELARVLYEIKAVDSIEQGKEYIPNLYDLKLNLKEHDSPTLEFTLVRDSKGKEGIKIETYGPVDYD